MKTVQHNGKRDTHAGARVVFICGHVSPSRTPACNSTHERLLANGTDDSLGRLVNFELTFSIAFALVSIALALLGGLGSLFHE
jgi:hypothetical protein